MKISVLGNIIDTKDIYQISPIIKDNQHHIEFSFSILFFNRKELTIYKKSGVYLSRTFLCIPKENSEDFKTGTLEKALNSNTYKNNLRLIESLREKIIKYWSNNQFEIPKIEFDETN